MKKSIYFLNESNIRNDLVNRGEQFFTGQNLYFRKSENKYF